MESLRQYVISVTAVALICGIVSSLLQKSAARELVKLICGVFLAVTVLRPVSSLDFSRTLDFSFMFSNAAEASVLDGEKMAQEALADIIKMETEAYILDKAAELNTEIKVEITMREAYPPTPAAAKISGDAAPYARQQLQTFLQSQLGISKENQQWTGDH